MDQSNTITITEDEQDLYDESAMCEDERLRHYEEAIRLAFEEPDLFMREIFFRGLLAVKWKRLTLLNG